GCDALPPVLVSQEIEYGIVITSAPRFAPSSLNCTPTTATLSEALALIVVVADTVAPSAGAVMLTLGGVVSLKTVTVTAAAGAVLPAASRATAVTAGKPLVGVVLFEEGEWGDVVGAGPRFAPSSLNCTPTTPTLSDALAPIVVVPETVAPAVGAVIETAGAVVSLKTVTVTVAAVVMLPATSRATALNECGALLAVVVSHAIEDGARASSAPQISP